MAAHKTLMGGRYLIMGGLTTINKEAESVNGRLIRMGFMRKTTIFHDFTTRAYDFH